MSQVDSETAPNLTESLLLWRSVEPLGADSVVAFFDAHGDVIMGDSAAIQKEWIGTTIGHVTIALAESDPSLDTLETSARALLEVADLGLIPSGSAITEKDGGLDIEPPALPAPPLSLQSRHPVEGGFTLRFRFKAMLAEAGKRALEALVGAFTATYEGPDGKFYADIDVTWAEEEASVRLVSHGVDNDTLRGHAYWLVENVDRFFKLAQADFVGETHGARRGLRPSWMGPVLVMAASFGATRLVAGADAAMASTLVWLFFPLVLTFLSRRYVGRITWGAAGVNAVLQGAAATVLAVPTLLWPVPEDVGNAWVIYQEELTSGLTMLLYSSRIIGLLWAAPYLMSRRRSI